jgi:hypothetical protein
MRATAAVCVLVAMATVPGPVMRLEAQQRVVAPPPPLMAIALGDLNFGFVLPGIAVSVSPRDIHAGLFEIAGPGNASVRVEFNLPVHLVASHGAWLPVSFGSADGFWNYQAGIPGGQVFNPHGPLISVLGASGRLYVRIGGTVLPGRPQPGGLYSATIYLTVYNLGS